MPNYFLEDNSEAYLGPYQNSLVEPFEKIINDFLPLIFFAKKLYQKHLLRFYIRFCHYYSFCIFIFEFTKNHTVLFAPIFLELTLMLKNGQTYFKNMSVFIPQDF